MISPGCCTQSIGRGPDHAWDRARGYIFWNHVTDSPSSPMPLGFNFALVKPRVGGNRHQRLRPLMRAFHALVARGSTWTLLPLRGGPMTTHRYGGLRFSPAIPKRSSLKYAGTA